MKNLILSVTLICSFFLTTIHAQDKTRLGIINPTPGNLENFMYLIQNGIIKLDTYEIHGIFHKNQVEQIQASKHFIQKNGYENISLAIVEGNYSIDSLFMENACSKSFREIFEKTDGIIFTGGADIFPGLYGEETFLTTDLMSNHRNWELSFMYHLTGRSTDVNHTPFLASRPDYVVLGICLGMQIMAVSGGGSLYQDIPYQVYKKTTYESIIGQDADNQHKSYRGKINNWSESISVTNFHRIKFTEKGFFSFIRVKNPLVASIHHQSVKKTGKDFKVSATSMDGKVIEAMQHLNYKNVYGIQFHPELPRIYKSTDFKTDTNKTILLGENDKQFHRMFWENFSTRFVKGKR
jgi:putative glutamine amidotransferase